MKSKHIIFRATQAQADRWSKASEMTGRDKSEICRNALDRWAYKAEKEASEAVND